MAVCGTPTLYIATYGAIGLTIGALVPKIPFYAGLVHGIATIILFTNFRNNLEKQFLRPLSEIEVTLASLISLTLSSLTLGTGLWYLGETRIFSWLIVSAFIFIFLNRMHSSLEDLEIRIR